MTTARGMSEGSEVLYAIHSTVTFNVKRYEKLYVIFDNVSSTVGFHCVSL